MNHNKELAEKIQKSGTETIIEMLDTLDRISTGRGICASYEFDPTPTEKELATITLNKIRNNV